MDSTEIRRRFLEFFQSRGHAIIPSAPLVPENDPSVLFTTAGMQPLVPYLLGEPHPAGTRLANVQKCVRTQDIDEVGDDTHDTFFEMLGNWSLGDYFKQETITWSYELLTDKDKGFGLDPARLSITVFAGDEVAPRDEESAQIWQSLGIPTERISYLGAGDNWWPARPPQGFTWSGPTGPCTEMFYDGVEVWNDVFMEYQAKDGQMVGKLSRHNVDTGAGLERLAMMLQGKANIFETDLFQPLMRRIEELTQVSNPRARRIVADHIRTAVFMIADGVTPANTDRGYILRRLLRRAVRYADILELKAGALSEIAAVVIEKYHPIYPNLGERLTFICREITEEEARFRDTLARGMKKFAQLEGTAISGTDAFLLFSTYGFPFELTQELARDRQMAVDEAGFKLALAEHQAKSRTGAEGKFKGGLASSGEQETKYHTTTHLLHQALRQVLGTHVEQKGSNITPERLRFDFTHPQKMTEAEKEQVAEIVNQKISESLPVQCQIMSRAEAEATGALHFFADKYGDQVSVYYIGPDLAGAYSKEFCGGPHVKNTGELGRFKILKEEAVAAGIRRIKAVLE
jgi:alanyl-tRNA synthetase